MRDLFYIKQLVLLLTKAYCFSLTTNMPEEEILFGLSEVKSITISFPFCFQLVFTSAPKTVAVALLGNFKSLTVSVLR